MQEKQAGASLGELTRRRQAVSREMEKQNLDFLLMQNRTNIFGGYLRWFADVTPPPDYPVTLVFSRDGEMMTIGHGADAPPVAGAPGVKLHHTVPALPSIHFTSHYEAEVAAAEMGKVTNPRIGIVGPGFIPMSLIDHLRKTLDGAVFTDATELVDGIKAVKSREEIDSIRSLCALQDESFSYALSIIRPGMRERDVYSAIYKQCLDTGSSAAIIFVNSAPAGVPALGEDININGGHRILQPGDTVNLLIESNHASGLYAELGRHVCLGEVPPDMQKQHDLAVANQRALEKLLQPGTDIRAIWDANNEMLREEGYAEERRMVGHGMGYDMVERPSFQPGETMKLAAGMNVVLHGEVVSPSAAAGPCQNYLVKESGGPECLHKTELKIFVV